MRKAEKKKIFEVVSNLAGFRDLYTEEDANGLPVAKVERCRIWYDVRLEMIRYIEIETEEGPKQYVAVLGEMEDHAFDPEKFVWGDFAAVLLSDMIPDVAARFSGGVWKIFEDSKGKWYDITGIDENGEKYEYNEEKDRWEYLHRRITELAWTFDFEPYMQAYTRSDPTGRLPRPNIAEPIHGEVRATIADRYVLRYIFTEEPETVPPQPRTLLRISVDIETGETKTRQWATYHAGTLYTFVLSDLTLALVRSRA